MPPLTNCGSDLIVLKMVIHKKPYPNFFMF